MSSSGHSLVGSQSRSDGQPCLNENTTSLNQRSTRASLIVSRYIEKSPGSATSISRTVRGPAGVACDSHVWQTWESQATPAGPRTVLEIEVAEPGDFSIYRLTINDARVDRWFNDVVFSFKQGCPSDLDCEPTSECPEEDMPEPRIDYLARDFTSFNNA